MAQIPQFHSSSHMHRKPLHIQRAMSKKKGARLQSSNTLGVGAPNPVRAQTQARSHSHKRSEKARAQLSRGSRMPSFFGLSTSLAVAYAKVGGMSRSFSRGKAPFYLPNLICVLGLLIFGTFVMYTASLAIPKVSFVRHLFGIALGVIAAIAMWRYDYRNLRRLTYALLILNVVLIIMPMIPGIGYHAKGLTGWVKLPLIGLRFQPSEPSKIVTILLMAAMGSAYNGKITELKEYYKLCGILSIPFLLILLQPDLGTGLIVLISGATIIICSGAKRLWIFVTVCALVGLSALVIVTSSIEGLPHILKPYQLHRLIVFIDSSVDPSGFGYNLQQAKIAVGSGGMFGKGIGNATQSVSGFLPEAHTDFVFALLAEEFGFMGSAVLLGLFGTLIFSTYLLAQRLENAFGKLVLVGCATMWMFQLLQNVGMCIGIMPITGIPLPFISFGSSSMVAQLLAVGLVQSVWRHIPKAA